MGASGGIGAPWSGMVVLQVIGTVTVLGLASWFVLGGGRTRGRLI
jgi:hypothetical protein